MRALRTAPRRLRPQGQRAGAPGRVVGRSRSSRSSGSGRDFDLVLHLPLRYEDETVLTPIAEARPARRRWSRATVVASDVAFRPRRQLVVQAARRERRPLRALPQLLSEPGEGARAGRAGARSSARCGRGSSATRWSTRATACCAAGAAARVADAGLPDDRGPRPGGLLRKLIDEALDARRPRRHAARGDRAPSALEPFRAVRAAAAPSAAGRSTRRRSRTARHPAWRRMKFDELLAQQLVDAHRLPRAARARRAPPLAPAATLAARLLARLPFELTRAQARAWAEIARDLAQPHPMNRLLQGDVGSGKTIVAALAAAAARSRTAGRRR